MISAKQLAANQANAHWSTGPRTPEGKAATRFNAVSHGLTGQLTIVAPSEHAAFTDLSERLTGDLKPSGEQELQIALRIVRDTWRLHRAAAHEDNIYAIGIIENGRGAHLTAEGSAESDAEQAAALTNARTFFNKLRDFNLAGLYQQRIHRSLMKDYALFRQLQHDRKREEAKHIPAPRPAVMVKTAAANGSDFSTIFEVPTARPELVNSAFPPTSPPAKTPLEATQAA